MHILFLVPYTPTLIRTRPYNLVRGLARRGHAVTLATLWENEMERAALVQLEREGIRVLSARLTKPRAFWNMLRALPTAIPLQATYCYQPQLVKRLLDEFQVSGFKFDVVHIEHLRGARYALQSPISNLQSPIVWDSVDCISHLFEQAARYSRSPFGRIVTRLELPRTRRYEAYLVNQFDRVLVTSPVDKRALENLVAVSGQRLGLSVAEGSAISRQPSAVVGRRSSVEVLPNGVDLDYFTPPTAPRDPATIVFTGKMSYHANVTAALHLINDIMPRVWSVRPNVRVNIVGHNPPHQLRNTQHVSRNTHHALRNTPHASRITITGSVPDLRPYLQRATLAVAPILYGAGIQNKVLEAMACATPVIASPQAVSALQVVDGEHLLLSRDAESFAHQILRLLDDTSLRERLGKAGRTFVEANHDWGKIVERLEEIYRNTINHTT
ncbi:MAG: glycosyltransferase [Anaerolineae bacterium]|nr:glycosyltransferase [Anaerolineae bacterium]